MLVNHLKYYSFSSKKIEVWYFLKCPPRKNLSSYLKNFRALAKNTYASIGKWIFLPSTIFLFNLIKKLTVRTVRKPTSEFTWTAAAPAALLGGEHRPGRSRHAPYLARLPWGSHRNSPLWWRGDTVLAQ